MHPLLISGNEEVINTVTESYPYGENEKLLESDNSVTISPVKDATKRKVGEGINFSDNTSDSSNPAHSSNSTSNNDDTEWAPGLGNPIFRTPTQDLSEAEKIIAKGYDEAISKWKAELDEESKRAEELRTQPQSTQSEQYSDSYVMDAEKYVWLEKVNSSALMKDQVPFKPNDFDFRERRELDPKTWFNTTIDYYNSVEQEKSATETLSDPEQNLTKTKNEEKNNQDKKKK